VKAENLFGFSSEWSDISLIKADSKPDPVDIVTTSLAGMADVLIEWEVPSDNHASLIQYEILILTKAGEYVHHPDCTG